MALIAWEAAWKAFCALRMSTSCWFWFTPEIEARLLAAVVARFDAAVDCPRRVGGVRAEGADERLVERIRDRSPNPPERPSPARWRCRGWGCRSRWSCRVPGPPPWR